MSACTHYLHQQDRCEAHLLDLILAPPTTNVGGSSSTHFRPKIIQIEVNQYVPPPYVLGEYCGLGLDQDQVRSLQYRCDHHHHHYCQPQPHRLLVPTHRQGEAVQRVHLGFKRRVRRGGGRSYVPSDSGKEKIKLKKTK